MPHRRLVKIGETPALPTISQFLSEMAARQHEEIQRLKSEALSGKLPDATVPQEHHEDLTPDPWQLHPVRIKRSPKKATPRKKAAKKSSRKSAVTKVKATKTAKKAVRRTAKKVSRKRAVKPVTRNRRISKGSKK